MSKKPAQNPGSIDDQLRQLRAQLTQLDSIEKLGLSPDLKVGHDKIRKGVEDIIKELEKKKNGTP